MTNSLVKKVGLALVLAAISLLLVGVPGGQIAQAANPLLISEIRIDQPSTDNDEYFELVGTPGDSLDGVTYLVIGDGVGSGTIEMALDLTGQVIPGDGIFVAAESTFTLGTADLTTTLNFENSDNVTHVLVEGFTGAVNDDLDADDNGTLDYIPWTLTHDLIALIEEANPPSGTEYHYGPPTVGPDGSFVPGHVYRCGPDWEIGPFDPVGGDDTPGAANPCVTPPPAVTINEVRIDQPSTDNDEYFELAGAPGTSLDGLTYLVIGDGAGSGTIEAVVDLTGQTIPGSGYFVAAEATFALGTANLVANLNFENSDNVTHMLVQGFTGANGDDLDADDDGTLDVEPWTVVLDLIALIEEANPPGATEYHYGPPTVGPDGIYVPGHVYRCGAVWEIGAFDPVGGDDTPGAANPCVVPPPAVTINEVRIDQPSTDNDEYFELAGTPSLSLDGLTYLVIGDGTDGSGVIESVVDLTGQTIPASGYFVAAEATFTLGTANLTTNLNFENSDNVTHMLVQGFTGADGDDLDTNDDGTLDVTPWTSQVDVVALIETVGSGDQTYGPPDVGPDGTFVPGHVYYCDDGWRIGGFGLGTNDTPGAENVCTAGGACGDAADLIHDVQGAGLASPIDGSSAVIEGIVVGDFQDVVTGLRGFFVQEEDADIDADALTSEGIFVYDNGFGVDVAVGDVVRVAGTVDEYYDLTELTGVVAVTVCSTTSAPAPAPITLPVATLDEFEAYEGMLVTFPQTLYATDNYSQGRYGEVGVSVFDRLYNPTNVVAPGAAAIALQDLNDRSRIQIDDGSNVENPPPLPPYLGVDNTLRGGDTTSGVTGVLGYAYGVYELHPTQAVSFTRANARDAVPADVGGTVRVASFNVLNYFTTIDDSGAICGPLANQDCRGADTAAEFTRQRDKIINAIVAMDAQVVGLMEIENHAADAAVIDLVNGLNAAAGAGTYDYIATGPIGSDAIKVAMIYQPAVVSPVGAYAILDASVDPAFNDEKNRPALAQTFEENATGALFTVVVNHLKSKGSACDDVGDPDMGDGQGNCNLTRLAAANALVSWLATDPTGSGDDDFLIIGDLNSYAMEDPIAAITGAGYTNLVAAFGGMTAYSYSYYGQYGYLDHALSNPTLTPQVTGATTWHINADEPSALDYNDYNQPALYNADAYRASDHDPVVVGLNLAPPGEVVEPVVGHANVTLTARVSASGISIGDTVFWTFTVTNPMDVGTFGLTFRADVPDMLGINGVTSTQGEPQPLVGQTVWVELGNIGPGGSVVINIETELSDGTFAEALKAMRARLVAAPINKAASRGDAQEMGEEVCVMGTVATQVAEACTLAYPDSLPLTGAEDAPADTVNGPGWYVWVLGAVVLLVLAFVLMRLPRKRLA